MQLAVPRGEPEEAEAPSDERPRDEQKAEVVELVEERVRRVDVDDAPSGQRLHVLFVVFAEVVVLQASLLFAATFLFTA